MNKNDTPINHSEIFSSVESFLEFFSPKDVDGTEEKMYRPFTLPSWHPFHTKGINLITGVKILEDGKISLLLTHPVSHDYPFEVALKNNWMVSGIWDASFEDVKAYFVNGTFFGKDGGSFVVENGPTTFTWTYAEPKIPLCEECESKEAAK